MFSHKERLFINICTTVTDYRSPLILIEIHRNKFSVETVFFRTESRVRNQTTRVISTVKAFLSSTKSTSILEIKSTGRFSILEMVVPPMTVTFETKSYLLHQHSLSLPKKRHVSKSSHGHNI